MSPRLTLWPRTRLVPFVVRNSGGAGAPSVVSMAELSWSQLPRQRLKLPPTARRGVSFTAAAIETRSTLPITSLLLSMRAGGGAVGASGCRSIETISR
jgi:hypothetical protein